MAEYTEGVKAARPHGWFGELACFQRHFATTVWNFLSFLPKVVRRSTLAWCPLLVFGACNQSCRGNQASFMYFLLQCCCCHMSCTVRASLNLKHQMYLHGSYMGVHIWSTLYGRPYMVAHIWAPIYADRCRHQNKYKLPYMHAAGQNKQHNNRKHDLSLVRSRSLTVRIFRPLEAPEQK